MTTKDIQIVGQYNRYNIKKLLNIEKNENIRNSHLVRCETTYGNHVQHTELEFLIENIENHEQIEKGLLQKELEHKLNAYKQQDREKNMFDELLFVNLHQLTLALKASGLKCAYCSMDVKLLYNKRLDEKQWTIDRIDNNIGHNHDNYVIACLTCNLKKGRTSHEKFDFTKKMVIVKKH